MPDLTVADNITLSDPPRRFGLIDGRAQRRRAEALLARIGCEDINPLQRVRDLPLSRQPDGRDRQGARPRIRSSSSSTRRPRRSPPPTSSASTACCSSCAAQGLGILYISHRMHEIEALAETCSVFRNGRHIETFPKGARSRGRDRRPDDRPRDRDPVPAKARPAAAGAAHRGRGPRLGEPAAGVSLAAGRGEILGLGGLDGQGQKELLLALFGVLRGVCRARSRSTASRPSPPRRAPPSAAGRRWR